MGCCQVGDLAGTKGLPPRAFAAPESTWGNYSSGLHYLEAVYWATMMTTGMGVEFAPTTPEETVFEVLVSTMGVLGYAIFLGSATSAINQRDISSAKRKARLAGLQQFVRRRALPLWLRTRLLNFYDYSLTRQQALVEITSLNEELPSELKLQLDLVINYKLLSKVSPGARMLKRCFMARIEPCVIRTSPHTPTDPAREHNVAAAFMSGARFPILRPDGAHDARLSDGAHHLHSRRSGLEQGLRRQRTFLHPNRDGQHHHRQPDR